MTRWLVVGISLVAVSSVGAQPVEPVGPADQEPLVRYVVPEPSILPLSWQLDLSYRKPMRLVVEEAGRKPVHYWFVIYTVSNSTGKPIDYLPRIQMLTDKMGLVTAEMAIAPALFNRIKTETKAKYLEQPLQVHRVLSGADNARDTIALFVLPEDPKWFRVFFCGLSGEDWTVKVPDPATGLTRDVKVEKVRALEFSVPGNTPPDRMPPVEQKLPDGDKWVMRIAPPKRNLAVDLNLAAQGRVEDAVYEVGKPPQPAPAPAPPTTQNDQP